MQSIIVAIEMVPVPLLVCSRDVQKTEIQFGFSFFLNVKNFHISHSCEEIIFIIIIIHAFIMSAHSSS